MAGPFDDLIPQAAGNPFADLIPQQPAGLVANAGAGASRGFYGDVLGAPVEAANWLLKQAGLGSERPIGGSEDMRSVSDYIASLPARGEAAIKNRSVSPLFKGKSVRVEPTNENERIVYAGGRAAGQVAGTIMGGHAIQAASAPSSIVNWIGGVLKSQPKTQLISAGTGGTVGEATDNPWLGLLAGVGTGVAINAGQSLGRGLLAPLYEGGRKAQAGKAIAQFSRENADDLIRRLEARGDIVPGSPRTTAEVTRNAGIANMERGLRNDPGQVSAFNNIDQTRANARTGQLTGAGPGGIGSPRVQQVVGQNVSRYTDAATTTVDDIAAQAGQTANRATQGAIPPQAAGAGIRAPFNQAYETARTATDNAYDAARAASTGIGVNPEVPYVNIARRVSELYGNGINEVPSQITKTLQFLRSGNVTLAELDNLRGTMLRLARDNANTNSTVANVATHAAGQIDDYIGALVNSGQLDDGVAQLWRAARQRRLDQGNVFERSSTTGQLSKRGDFGNTAIPDSEVPGVFAAGRNAPENMDDFTRALGNNPQAMRSMEGYLRDQVQQKLFSPDGTFRPQQAQQWMRQFENVLNQFPQIRDDLNAALARSGFADDVANTSRRGVQDLERGILGKIASGGPDDAWQSIMAQNDPVAAARRVRTELGDNAPALKQAAIDWIRSKATNTGDTLSNAKFAKIVDDMGPVLRAAGFSREEIGQILAVGDDLKSAAFAQNAGRPIGSNTQQNAMTTRSLELAGHVPFLNKAAGWLTNAKAGDMTEALGNALRDPAAAQEALRAYLTQQGLGQNTGGLLGGLLLGPSAATIPQSLDMLNKPPLRIVVTR